ncbi:glycerol-3-phosphatase [Terrihabitans soli]|uniref:Glycerol-3-phosphatase n=1 Tax=Terrihabitans soli TaxID=708113 RepID=A0A6S6QSM2_9HYPH|nr:HAD-IA family hydrolase [Terrihabitans soli]BCJ89458.1 glycerol-3-phosphatase [Terrihabitans soli]
MQNLFGGRAFAAFIFDIDGTLLTSIAASERVWTAWAVRHGIEVEPFLKTIHGRRAEDTVRAVRPDLDAVAEAADITRGEIADIDGVVPIAGAAEFLSSLPHTRWAIVTSAPIALAERRLAAAGLPLADVLITAEDVARGKPHPDGYLLAAERLGCPAKDCLVFEDAEAGILAAERAGAEVLVITATHPHAMKTAHAVADDYRSLRSVTDEGGKLALQKASV